MGAIRPESTIFGYGKCCRKEVNSKVLCTSTIEAKGEIPDQVRALANHVPFDERGNETIKIDDNRECLYMSI